MNTSPVATADVVICGAGPPGSALAALLAKEGVDVLLIDRKPVPTFSVGESLLPFGNRVLEAIGVKLEGFLQKNGAVFTMDERAARIDFSEAARPTWKYAHQVQRADFDARVRQAAVDAGARLMIAKVESIDPPCARTDQGIVRGNRVIDAMGRDGMLATKLGLRQYHPQLRNAARTMWFEGVRRFEPETLGDIVIACFEGGWFWFIPFANGITSVGSVTTKDSGIKGDWEASLARCPAARQRLEGATSVSEMRGLQDFSAVSERFWGDGWALCGDAAVFIDPIFSSGVLLGLEGAAGLADAIQGRQPFEQWQATYVQASKAFESVAMAFYDRSFLKVLFAEKQDFRVRAEIVSLLAGDVVFNTAPGKMAARLGTLAKFVDREEASVTGS